MVVGKWEGRGRKRETVCNLIVFVFRGKSEEEGKEKNRTGRGGTGGRELLDGLQRRKGRDGLFPCQDGRQRKKAR